MQFKNDKIRFLFAVTVGGVFAVSTLLASVSAASVFMQEKVVYADAVLSCVLVIIFALLTVWATGFWGKWGMVLFFLFAPLSIVLDATLNPFFPLGVIVFASLCFGLFKSRGRNA